MSALTVHYGVLERDGFDGEHPFYFAVVAEDPNINTADDLMASVINEALFNGGKASAKERREKERLKNSIVTCNTT
ncbi:unnamed protein product [Bemisia tabaci]|uniref:Uncharacterized protein n=1 Tax=Bemisia tabaci TaxID=7038 RepID=A0A9P0AMN9_BEMTA|nr:unnamed protein product [Bemisia tabaci]